MSPWKKPLGPVRILDGWKPFFDVRPMPEGLKPVLCTGHPDWRKCVMCTIKVKLFWKGAHRFFTKSPRPAKVVLDSLR